MANSGRSAKIPRNRHLVGAIGRGREFRTSLIIGRWRRIFGRSWKSRASADSPAGRFFGERVRFMANLGRSAEISRNSHIIGAIGGGNLGPH